MSNEAKAIADHMWSIQKLAYLERHRLVLEPAVCPNCDNVHFVMTIEGFAAAAVVMDEFELGGFIDKVKRMQSEVLARKEPAGRA